MSYSVTAGYAESKDAIQLDDLPPGLMILRPGTTRRMEQMGEEFDAFGDPWARSCEVRVGIHGIDARARN
jgi:hypothetical protein